MEDTQNQQDGRNHPRSAHRRQKQRLRVVGEGSPARSEHSATPNFDERNMRRKPNHNNGGNNKNNGGQMSRRRFRPEQNAGKIKSATANRDKYLNLAREAMSQGDRIEAENFLQHADHYFRVMSALHEEDARNRPERTEQAQVEGEEMVEGAEATAEVEAEVEAEGEVESDEEAAPLKQAV